MTADLSERWRFFLAHAGYVVGRRAAGALELARAEEVLDRAECLDVASFDLLDDDFPYDPGDVCTEEEAREKFESNEWTGPYVATVAIGDERASLAGIVVGPAAQDDPYIRVVRAELASELLDELRRAVERAERET